MPIVDYNRIYGVRARERQPVTYSPNMVPDAARAYMGAAGAVENAKANIARDRANERNNRLRAQYAALGNLIGVGKEVGVAYARAVERRDEADFNALAAAWQTHMNEGAPAAFRRQYVRGGENGEGADGPARAIRELDASFDEGDAFTNARDSVKERFAQWRTKARQSYYGRGDEKQADAADAFNKQMTLAHYAAEDANIASLRGLQDGARWETAVKSTLDERMEEVWKKFPEVAAANPEWMESTRRNLEEQYHLDRLKEWTASLAASQIRELDPDLLAAAEAYAKGEGPFELSAAGKAEAAKLVEAAKRTHESNIAAIDRKTVEEFDNVRSRIDLGDVSDMEIDEMAAKAEASLANIEDRIRLPLIKKIRESVGVRHADLFLGRYRSVENAEDLDPDEKQEQILQFLGELSEKPDGIEKQAIMNQLYPPATEKRFSSTEANAYLRTGVSPAVVIDKARSEYVAGAMKWTDYVQTCRDCRTKLTFNNATGGQTAEYTQAIFGALNDAFYTDFGSFLELDENGAPEVDAKGQLVPKQPGREYQTGVAESNYRNDVGFVTRWLSPAVAYDRERKNLRLTADTMTDAFRLGMEHVIARKADMDRGKGDPLTPTAVRAELAEAFRQTLDQTGELRDLVIQNAIRGRIAVTSASYAPTEEELAAIVKARSQELLGQ